MANGKLSSTIISSYLSDFDEALEKWQHRLYEVSTRKCVRITRYVQRIGFEGCEPLRFDGFREIEDFIEAKVPREVRIQALDIALKATSARWWGTHKAHLQIWYLVKTMMMVRFTKQT